MFYSYTELDRTIFERIRKEVVLRGYLPDVTLYATSNLYKAAKEALKASLPDKQLIEVFSVGAADSRDEKTICKIVIDRVAGVQSKLRASGVYYFRPRRQDNKTVFDKVKYPNRAKNIEYDIRIICDSTKFERKLHSIVEQALGTFNFINVINAATGVEDVTRNFFIEQLSDTNLSNSNTIEWVMTYRINDVFIMEGDDDGVVNGGEVIQSGIPQLLSVNHTDVTHGYSEYDFPEYDFGNSQSLEDDIEILS